MSAQPRDLDDVACAQTTKNIELIGAFLQDIVAQPALLETIPRGATVVPIPDDDPILAQANLRLAEQAAVEGKDVRLYHIDSATARGASQEATGVLHPS